jgi:hypothetical protein
MTWLQARAQVVSIIEGVAPVVRVRGLAPSFREDPTGSDLAAVGSSRRFWIRTTSGAPEDVTQPLASRWRVLCDLVVEYPDDVASTAALDLSVVDDATRIIYALLDGANWARPTSTIERIATLDNTLAPFVVEQLTGARRLRITLSVRYRQ